MDPRTWTPLQWLGVVVLLNGVIIGGTTQLTDLFGAGVTHKLVSIAGLGNMFFGGMVTMFSGQGTMIRNVAAMPGVESIKVNGLANTALAQIAIDPDQAKVESTPQAEAKVFSIAKAG